MLTPLISSWPLLLTRFSGRRLCQGKVTGPDNICPRVSRVCANEMSRVLPRPFNPSPSALGNFIWIQDPVSKRVYRWLQMRHTVKTRAVYSHKWSALILMKNPGFKVYTLVSSNPNYLSEKISAHTLMQITYIYRENDNVSILAQPKSRPGTGYSWFSHLVWQLCDDHGLLLPSISHY